MGAMTDLAVMGLLLGQCIGRWANFINREAFGAETTLPWRMRLWTSATEYIEVHPTFFYESLWNLIGLLLILLVVSKARRFDGENTWFYFLWYGLGRFWIEGLRTDSLYLFNWTFLGQPIRVSQALSLLLAVTAAVMLFYNIKIKKHSRDELLVNQVAAEAVEGTAEADISTAEAGECPCRTGGAGAPQPPETQNGEGERLMATRIDGKALAAKVKAQTAEAAKSLYRRPGLAVILVGNDPASRVYVTGKEKDCAECGFEL